MAQGTRATDFAAMCVSGEGDRSIILRSTVCFYNSIFYEIGGGQLAKKTGKGCLREGVNPQDEENDLLYVGNEPLMITGEEAPETP